MNRQVMDKVIDALEGPSGLKREVLEREVVNALPLRSPWVVLWYALCEYRPLSSFPSRREWVDWHGVLWDALRRTGDDVMLLKQERDDEAKEAFEERERRLKIPGRDGSADPLEGVMLYVDDDQVWDDDDYPEDDGPDDGKIKTTDEYAHERGVWEFQRYLDCLEEEDEGWKRNERDTRRHQGDRHER